MKIFIQTFLLIITIVSYPALEMRCQISGVPTYTCTITNDTLSSDGTKYEFDIYLLRTGTNAWELSGIQYGFAFNNKIKNGTTTATWVPGSIDPAIVSSGQTPGAGNMAQIVNDTCILKVAAKIPTGGAGSGPIITNAAPGMRFGRLRITCAAKFYSNMKFNLQFNFTHGNPTYPTQPGAYVPAGGGGTDLDITSTGTFVNNLANHTTSVQLSPIAALPESFELSQNFPNPFNPTTTIRYNISFESNIKLNVFNSLGENVHEFQIGTKPAGFYELNFNSIGLSSGVYFYSLLANSTDGKHSFRETRKMILMK